MTGSNDNRETHDFAADGWVQRFFRGPRDFRYRLVVWMFLLASATHLWLADAAQPDWMPANIVYVLGLIVLLPTGGAVGWWLCTVGLLIPLFFLRDQLTQSVILAMVSGAGGLLVVMDARRGGEDTFRSAVPAFLWLCKALAILTYLFAGFHKLNRDFFNADLGCATYGLRELAVYYHLPAGTFDVLGDGHAAFAVALEVAIPLAYLLGRRHIARLLAVVFHIPLTLTMAPAFAFVMAVGHAAFVTRDEATALIEFARRHARWLIPAGLVTTGASLAAHRALPEITMIPREFVLWTLLFWFVAYLPRALSEGRIRDDGASIGDLPRRFQVVAVACAIAFTANCFTPYLGVQFQHAGAMLSNLRIDEGCWNHLLVPESVRLTEDYVRVHEVWFGEPGRIEEYEHIVLDQLWSPPQIRQMRRNWCRPEVRPFHMRGTFRDRDWVIEDLCDIDEPWPFEDDGVFGVEVFSDFLRYQKNLERECPQSCIH